MVDITLGDVKKVLDNYKNKTKVKSGKSKKKITIKKKKKKKKKKKEELQATAAESGITWEDQSLVDIKILAGIMNDGQANDEYSYDNKIKKPSDIGISKKGEWNYVEKNIVGLNSYVDALISGKSRAVVGGEPLGDKKFVDTGIKCKDSDDVEHDRYFYVNNVPHSKSMGGLIPAAVSKFGEFDVNEIGEIFSSSEDNEKNICSACESHKLYNAITDDEWKIRKKKSNFLKFGMNEL